MIIPVEMYQCVCDGCGKGYVDEFNGYGAWGDESTAREEALEGGWHEIDGKFYCPGCVEWNEETDDYVLKTHTEEQS